MPLPEVGAYAAINGGFFSGSSSVSSIVYPGEVRARNLISVTRTVGGVTQTYPVIRPIFALNTDRSPFPPNGFITTAIVSTTYMFTKSPFNTSAMTQTPCQYP
jgi:hypothetical protein